MLSCSLLACTHWKQSFQPLTESLPTPWGSWTGELAHPESSSPVLNLASYFVILSILCWVLQGSQIFLLCFGFLFSRFFLSFDFFSPLHLFLSTPPAAFASLSFILGRSLLPPASTAPLCPCLASHKNNHVVIIYQIKPEHCLLVPPGILTQKESAKIYEEAYLPPRTLARWPYNDWFMPCSGWIFILMWLGFETKALKTEQSLSQVP